jgi:hypothetical protein
MNPFYEQKPIFQWGIALVMLCILGVSFYYWMELMQTHFLAILFIFIVTPLGQFLISPLMKLTGVYKYVSPMLLIYAPNKKRYDLHNGTSFDYLFIFRGNNSGLTWQNQLLLFYIEGLLKIIDEVSENMIPETIEIRGSSYFFSDRTAKRLGFELEKTGIFERLNIVINYLDLIWMFSLAKGRIQLPKLSDIKTATTTGIKLKEKKEDFLKLKAFLKSRSR